jgi:hypothetical protein
VIIKEYAGEAIALRRDIIYALHAESAYSNEIVTTTKLIEQAQRISSETQALIQRITKDKINKN